MNHGPHQRPICDDDDRRRRQPRPWPRHQHRRGRGRRPVIAVARTPGYQAGVANIQRHVADAGDPTVAGGLLTATSRGPWSWSPAQPRSCARCSTTPGRRSRSTGTPTFGSRSLGARGIAQAAGSRQQGDRDQQRRRAAGFPAQWRVRRCQGHPALYHRLRPRRSHARRSRDHVHRGAATARAADRSRSTGGPRLRSPQRPDRGAVPAAVRPITQPRSSPVPRSSNS